MFDMPQLIKPPYKIYILTFITITCSLNAQFWSHTFESSGGYTASISEFSDGSEDYWGRIDLTNKEMTDGTSIGNGASSVSGFGGDWVFGACDIDGEGATLPVNIVFDDIDISSKTKLLFKVKIAEDDDSSNEDWDATDYVRFYYDIDNSGSWSNLMFIENDGTTSNTAPGIDSDFDGNNDGILITDTFVLFEKYISGTGSTIDIKIEWNLNSGDEDLYIDNLVLYDGIAISGNSGFRMMSSPVAGQIYSDLLAELWTQGMTGADVTDGTANVWTLNVSGQSWTAITDISGSGASLTAGTGFLVYVFADTDWDGDSDLPVSLSVSGSENSSSASLGSIADGNYGLAGNPYASTIDWDDVTKSSLSATVNVWDDATSGWKSWNGSSGSLTNGLIAPYQGFWVEASGGTGSVTIETADKSSSSGTFYRTLDNDSTGSVSFDVVSADYADQTFMSFMNIGEAGLDNADGKKLLPFQASARVVGLSYTDETALDIHNLPYIYEGSLSIPLDVMRLSLDEANYVTVAEEVTLTWDLEELPDHISMTLTDNITGSETYLELESEYVFTTEPKGSFSATYDGPIGTYPVVGEPRFTLSVTYGALGQNGDATLPSDFALHPIYPNPFNPSATISFDIPDVSSVALNIYDVKGALVETLLQNHMKPGKHHYNWEPQGLSSGVYFMKLTTAKQTFTQKVTYIK
jgi:hypothetical protein